MNTNKVLESAARRGQVVVLVALMMVVLVGITGLTIDVSGAYLSARFQRSVADAAALAGTQDLQSAGSRAVPANGYTNARREAMQSLINQLAPGTSAPGSCPTTSDVVNCQLTGTDYYVSIKTPSPSPTLNDPTGIRSVQVTVRRPHFGLAFARIFGILQWSVAETSVAGIGYAASYGVVTLRPPKPINKNDPSCAPYCDQNYDDIKLSNSVLNVDNSDIGTNTNLAPTNFAAVNLSPGYNVYRYDQYQFWTSPPPSVQLQTWITDPNYTYPDRSGTIPIYDVTSGVDPDPTKCANEQAKAVLNGYSFAGLTVTCYRPGIYNGTANNQFAVSSNTKAALLEPGVYFFDTGADIGGTLIGGYEGGQPGVALVFPECGTSACEFNGANAVLIALNFGVRSGGSPATAAIGFDNQPVQTSTNPAIPMTLLVTKDNPNLCYPAAVDPASCTGSVENGHHTLQLPGNSNLFVGGVQYAPTDNVTVHGNNSNTNGQLGQIISWTITYTGGAVMNQVGVAAVGNGILRLDAVCSDAGHVNCNNPEVGAPIP